MPTSPAIWAWAFEARSIQEHLTDTGRLADAVGASLQVDRLTGDLGEHDGDDLLGQVLDATGLAAALRFSRRGGGAFIAFASDAAALARARALWHAALDANAPGLRWSDALAAGDSPPQAAAAALARAQAGGQFDPPALPEATPAQARMPRTGRAAVAMERLGAQGVEPVDRATRARRHHRRHGRDTLSGRFAADSALRWPTHFEPRAADAEPDDTGFPFVGEARDVAWLHADGNGLGVLLRRLAARTAPERYIEQYALFSQALAEATRAAARRATAAVLVPAGEASGGVFPARPLVLGGDDLLMVVRADLALDCAEHFLLAFEQETATRLQPLAAVLGLGSGEGLTAACGLLVAKASHPFAAATAQAHALCDRAKRVIKREALRERRGVPLGAVAFARVQGSLDEDELPRAADGRRLGFEAYVVGDSASALPRLSDLRALAAALGAAAAPRGPARRLLTDLHADLPTARERMRRMREIQGAAWTPVADAMCRLGVPAGAELPFADGLGTEGASPWPDALLLRDLAPAPGEARDAAQTEETAA